VRKYPSCKKILREVKKVMKISLVHTNGKKECSEVKDMKSDVLRALKASLSGKNFEPCLQAQF
jgi:hypothetical protein